MHPSAIEFGTRFFNTYCKDRSGITIVDVGSQDVNGSLRNVSLKGATYIGVDFVHGKGVDIVLDDPYRLPFEDGSVDVVVCSSVFEHSQFFWVLFLEVMRILKPAGLFYLNAPSNGYVHRYPVDCWRFYPDSGLALIAWAERNGYTPALLESFVGEKNCISINDDAWNDFVAVFVKDSRFQEVCKERILHSLEKYANAYCDDGVTDAKKSELTDDFLLIKAKNVEIAELGKAKNVEIAELGKAKNVEIAELGLEVMELRCALNAQKDSLDKMCSSLSWRVTAPLRNIMARFRP